MIQRPSAKILIVGPAWVGDMVMAQTLFILIKQQQPDATIDVLAPNWSRPLLQRMPQVRQGISLPIGHGKLALSQRYQIAKTLRQGNYSQAILLPNSLKSALIPWWAKIPKRTGWRGEFRFGLLNDLRYLDKEKYPLMIQRFMALGLAKDVNLPASLPRPNLQVDANTVQQTLHKFKLTNKNKPILALCPGAEFGPAKRWPEQHYAEVACEKLNEGWQVWLFGSAKDQQVTDKIQQQTNHQCINLAGRTSLGEAIDLLSVANGVVSNDSGLMHIAAALNRPLVVVYGSSSPKFTPPLNDQVKILNLDLACSPCFKRECKFGHLKCLQDLKAEVVINALKDYDGEEKGEPVCFASLPSQIV